MIVQRQIGGEFYASDAFKQYAWFQGPQNSSSLQQQKSVANELFLALDAETQVHINLSSLVCSQTPHYALKFPLKEAIHPSHTEDVARKAL